LQTLTGDSLSQSAEARIVEIRTFCNKVSKARTGVEKMLEARDVLDGDGGCSLKSLSTKKCSKSTSAECFASQSLYFHGLEEKGA
jgi:hypothetical protein